MSSNMADMLKNRRRTFVSATAVKSLYVSHAAPPYCPNLPPLTRPSNWHACSVRSVVLTCCLRCHSSSVLLTFYYAMRRPM